MTISIYISYKLVYLQTNARERERERERGRRRRKMERIYIVRVFSLANVALLLTMIGSVIVVVCETKCFAEEREALLEIKKSVTYPNGSLLSDWEGQNCCDWSYVTCDDSTSRVISIYFLLQREPQLGSWYPNASFFAAFTHLQSLYLNNNNISGFQMPTSLCTLTNLSVLDLSRNNLYDDNLPSCLGNLSKLHELYLGGNNLRGDFFVSSGICEMRELTWLDLENNLIEGRIPPCIGTLHSLRSLSLSRNHFEGGFMFSTFANLSSLENLDLSNNPMLEIETEFPTWIPSFQLDSIDLSNCKVNKGSGGQIPSFLATQYNFQRLHLSNCNLAGNIPSWLFYNQTELGYVTVSLNGNSLNGTFPLPSLHSTNSSIYYLDISENQIHGPLPPSIHTLLPKLAYFNMSRNFLSGTIPSRIGGEHDTVTILNLSENDFSGDLPVELILNSTSLAYLRLSDNNLQWDMQPTAVGVSNGSRLELLNVRRNALFGPVPRWLPTLPKLSFLMLSENHLGGEVPHEICLLESLRLLDLSHNSLSGNIPPCFNNITPLMQQTTFYYEFMRDAYPEISKDEFVTKGMAQLFEGLPFAFLTGIDLSVNQFMGPIPQVLGNLKALHFLNLSHNLLTGPFPPSFQNLENLESLDLSYNGLTGSIPQQITQLYRLAVFNVSYNNLSGMLPDFKNQFSTFSGSSYIGNPTLCGQPLTTNCSTKQWIKPSEEMEVNEEGSNFVDSRIFFFSFVALSYALGFWGFLALICLNKSWRHKYFLKMDQTFGIL